MENGKKQPEDPAGERVSEFFDQRDYLLRELVAMANRAPTISFGITLSVNGSVITGNLVSGYRYFNGLADSFVSTLPDGEDKESLRRYLASPAQLYRAPTDKSTEANAASESDPHFVHLEDARIWLGADFAPTGVGTLWRCKISAVDGFTLGLMSTGRPNL
jgi:hypothetical protein